MSLFANWGRNSAAGLPDASPELVLIVKWTAVLALAWLAHAVLAGRNPRWRVALWRSACVGLVLVAVLSLAPPIVTYPSVSRDPASDGSRRYADPTAPAFAIHEAPAFAEREPAVAIRPALVLAPSVVTVRRDDPALAVASLPRSLDSDGEIGSSRDCGGSWLAGVLVAGSPGLVAGSGGLAPGHPAIVGCSWRDR